MPLPILILILWEDALKSSLTPTWWSCSWAVFFWLPGGPSGSQICNALSSPLSTWRITAFEAHVEWPRRPVQDNRLQFCWQASRQTPRQVPGFSIGCGLYIKQGKNCHILILTSSFPRWTACIAQRSQALCLTQRLFGRSGGPVKPHGIALDCHPVRPRILLSIPSRFRCYQWRRNFGCHTKIDRSKDITRVAPCSCTVVTIR